MFSLIVCAKVISFFVIVCFYFFLSGSRKKKDNKKERLPSALFELLRHFSALNKKNSLRSDSFLFLTLRKAPPLHAQKVRPDFRRNIASLVGVGVFSFILCYIHSRTNQPPTSEAMFILSTNPISSGI